MKKNAPHLVFNVPGLNLDVTSLSTQNILQRLVTVLWGLLSEKQTNTLHNLFTLPVFYKVQKMDTHTCYWVLNNVKGPVL